MRKFVCPYCNEEHVEEVMKSHFYHFHEIDNAPSNFEEFQVRFAAIGADIIVGEDDKDEL